MGESGEIMIPTDGADVVIDESGAIYVDGNYMDTILVTDFEDYNYLIKTNDTMFELVEVLQ